MARSPSLVKKPLGYSPPFTDKWHCVLRKTYHLEVKHPTSTLKYCYFGGKETARKRERQGQKERNVSRRYKVNSP